jgi:hypothetical protein
MRFQVADRSKAKAKGLYQNNLFLRKNKPEGVYIPSNKHILSLFKHRMKFLSKLEVLIIEFQNRIPKQHYFHSQLFPTKEGLHYK